MCLALYVNKTEEAKSGKKDHPINPWTLVSLQIYPWYIIERLLFLNHTNLVSILLIFQAGRKDRSDALNTAIDRMTKKTRDLRRQVWLYITIYHLYFSCLCCLKKKNIYCPVRYFSINWVEFYFIVLLQHKPFQAILHYLLLINTFKKDIHDICSWSCFNFEILLHSCVKLWWTMFRTLSWRPMFPSWS